MRVLFLLGVLFLFRGCDCIAGYHCIDEACLRKTLLTAYDNHVRPVKKASSHVPVWITITPIKIRELDEKNHNIELDTWLTVKWHDEYLKWDPNDHHGINNLVLPVSDIWRPDITLYTGTPDSSVIPSMTTNSVIRSNGDIIWVPPYTIKSRCPVSQKHRRRVRSPGASPYTSRERRMESIQYRSSTDRHEERHSDELICSIAIGSWTLSENLVDLKPLSDKVDMSNFDDGHHDWTLDTVTSRRVSKYYDCCEEPYAHINFTLTFRRHDHH
ncbi:neuronal acetylcholine receptor subunit alpha-6-like [Uloborus diversus]|uniref:neuronal acetylcholine receptor subunit alpha-6-like n=1 Tax=Uloborus diversus TaxID=327109 RepID=UPI0024090937|nr:neuronal acetylcholine receptor subunit alpha-6-like [Uloborus diversus]